MWISKGQCLFTYSVRQLVEKSWEHKAKIWFIFGDLKKAYDSVPREALRMAIEKLGVPDSLIDLIRSFHHGVISPDTAK